jgi:glucose uptake protein
MFTPASLSLALLMMITSAVCWGSWANTYKGVKGYRFELFYWDYAIGIFLIRHFQHCERAHRRRAV